MVDVPDAKDLRDLGCDVLVAQTQLALLVRGHLRPPRGRTDSTVSFSFGRHFHSVPAGLHGHSANGVDAHGRYAHTARVNRSSRKRLDPWVGPWLRAAREGRNVSRDEIARRLARNLSAVSRMESGTSSVPADDIPVVLKAYGLTAAQFADEAKRRARTATA